jgi:hypothetical protein
MLESNFFKLFAKGAKVSIFTTCWNRIIIIFIHSGFKNYFPFMATEQLLKELFDHIIIV